MSSLLTSSERTDFGQSFVDIFDTFAREVVIHKEPIKTVTSLNSTPLFGYGEETLPESVTYTPVTGVYMARVIYKTLDDLNRSSTTETQNPIAEAYIRVSQSGKDFIIIGKTEKITFDQKTWNVDYGFVVRRYLDQFYYEFKVKETT